MDEEQKYDEFGIPIKAEQPKQEVDEFGIPIKKNDFPTASEESLAKESTSPSTSQERLLKTTKTPIIPIENVDSVVQQQAYDEQKWHTDNVKLWLASKPLKKSQEQWTSDQRQKVR